MPSENSHVILKDLPVKILNGNESVTVNAFDSRPDSTFLAQNVASCLNLMVKNSP